MFRALRREPGFYQKLWALRAANGSRFDLIARELPAPGPRAYFCHAAKVGKNALKPTV